MAGVDDLIARGWVDPEHLGVTGGSGGGLLTNWVIGHTQRFKAAVSQRDIADWTDFWYTADFTLFTPSWFRGAPWEQEADFKARSPITYIREINTPLMLIEGEADYRTPPGVGRRADVPRAEVPQDPDSNGALPRRIARAVAIRQPNASRRAPAAHRGVVRQISSGQRNPHLRRAVKNLGR